jgi:hypothetical protein
VLLIRNGGNGVSRMEFKVVAMELKIILINYPINYQIIIYLLFELTKNLLFKFD